MKKLLLLLLILPFCFAPYWDLHTEANMKIDPYIPKVELLGVDMTLPLRIVTLFGVCVAVDRVFGEASDDAMLETSLVSLGIMYIVTPKQEKGEFLFCSSIAVLHDLPPFKKWLHYDQYQPLIYLSPATTHLLSQIYLFNYVLVKAGDSRLEFTVKPREAVLSYSMPI